MKVKTLRIALSFCLMLVVAMTTIPLTSASSVHAAGATNILDKNALIAQNNLPQPQWFKDNIPFLDTPDANINGVYYYRWDNVRRHLRYTVPGIGYVAPEFSQPVGYAGGYDTISAAAGHFIYEARWLRNQRYLNDYESYWLGAGTDHARQYSEWLADADYNRYLVNGDSGYVRSLLPGLINLYNGWNDHYTGNVNGSGKGLYYITPVADATEFTESSYHSCDFFGGGEGYRPTINTYQYAAANAISKIAKLSGDSNNANAFANTAATVKSATQQLLWDPNHQFFMQVFTGNSCNQSWANQQSKWREEMGYTPWAYNLPDAQYNTAWQYLMDPSRFYAPYGPTTIERQNDFESEDPSTTVINHANINNSSSASNGKYVGQIDFADSFVRYTVWSPYDGTYPVTVYYANNSGATSTHNIIVNGNTGSPVVASYPNTGRWGQFSSAQKVTINVPLHAGSNTLEFRKGNNWAELDKITTNPYFDQNAIPPTPTPTNDANCCHWNGPSWPYETSQVLMGMANLLDNYPAQGYVNANNYFTLLDNYATTQHKNGKPYVAEAADADNPRWIYDGFNHSENYNHSTFNDLVINGLIGIRPRSDNTFEVNPLVPSTWNYFALENVPYHGHNLTVLWDRDGSHYGRGSGLQIFQDGSLISSSPNLCHVTATIGAPVIQPSTPRLENYASNPIAADEVHSGQAITQQYPQPISSYTFSGDNAWQALDGLVYYDDIPNSRWTNYQSPNASDYLGVDFGVPRPVNEIRAYFYDDHTRPNGAIRAPASYTAQYWDGSNWINVPNEVHSPATPAGNDANEITFSQVTTQKVRLVMNRQAGFYVGVTELEAWYPATNFGNSHYKIINKNSSKLVAVSGMSLSDGAQVTQWTDNGSPDHLWQLVAAGGGYYKIVNQNSGKLLAVDRESLADSANVTQWNDNGSPDHLWQIIDAGGGYYKIINKNSGKLLAVNNASLADGANIQQFSDNGTPDHLWRLVAA